MPAGSREHEPGVWEPEAASGNLVDELRQLMADHANHIERVRDFLAQAGGGRTEAMVTRALEDAGMYMLRLEAEWCGSSVEDGLRGI